MAIFKTTPNMYSNLNWKDIEQLMNEERFVLLLPIGSIEAHGPHCPLSTDTIISLEACLRAVQKLHSKGFEAFVLPPLTYGVTEVARNFPGTISITEKTFAAMISEICIQLINHGMSKICLFNSHLEPRHIKTLYDAIKEVGVKTGVKVLFTDITQTKYSIRLTDAFQKAETHADRYETSVVMTVDHLLVNEERRQKLEYLPINLDDKLLKEHLDSFEAMGMPEAYCGDPASASAEEGEEILNSLSSFIVEDIEDIFQAKNGKWYVEDKEPTGPNA